MGTAEGDDSLGTDGAVVPAEADGVGNAASLGLASGLGTGGASAVVGVFGLLTSYQPAFVGSRTASTWDL